VRLLINFFFTLYRECLKLVGGVMSQDAKHVFSISFETNEL
jgi:hypothetical protein